MARDDKSIFDFIDDSTLHSNLKVLPSGPIPPNPIQLLRSEKIATMFEELKAVYDYVIVDTAPSMILADTFLISRYADMTIYMIRAGKSKKKVLEFVLESEADGKLVEPLFLLNDVNMADAGYGYKYGYEYGMQNDTTAFGAFSDRIKSIFKRPGA